MTHLTNFRLCLVVFGDDFQPDDFTAVVGINPAEIYYKGDVSLKYPKAPARTETSWAYYSDRVQTILFDEDVSEPFCNLIENKISIIRKFSDKFNLSTHIVVVLEIVDGHTPAFIFSKRFLSVLHELDADFSIDSYVFY